MPKFKKKSNVIEAIQLNYANWNERGDNAVVEFLGDAFYLENPGGVALINKDYASQISDDERTHGQFLSLKVRTIHGEIAIVRHGDWIIPDNMGGRFYPCKPDVFAMNYEPVLDQYAPPDPTEADVREHQRARATLETSAIAFAATLGVLGAVERVELDRLRTFRDQVQAVWDECSSSSDDVDSGRDWKFQIGALLDQVSTP